MSKTVLELREERNKLWNTAKNFLDSKRGSNGLVPPEVAAEYDKMEADMINLGKEIERLERQAAFDIELNKPTSNPIKNMPSNYPDVKTGIESEEYKKDFLNIMRGKPQVHNVLSTTPDIDGGYLVPVEFDRRIVEGLSEANVIRRLARRIRTTAERKIPVLASTPVATWTAENAEFTESNPTFAQKTIDAFKLTVLSRISTELLQDSMFDLASELISQFIRAFGVAEEEAFCVGTGSGQPTGIFTAQGADVGVTIGTTAIKTDDLIDLIYKLKSPYRRNAVFLMKDITVSAVRKLKDNNGQYLWQPSVQAGEPDRLLGYPLHTSPYVPAVEDDSLPVAFGDFNNYWIADRAGRTVQRLDELYATNGQVGFLAAQRVDAKVILSEGIKLIKISGS